MEATDDRDDCSVLELSNLFKVVLMAASLSRSMSVSESDSASVSSRLVCRLSACLHGLLIVDSQFRCSPDATDAVDLFCRDASVRRLFSAATAASRSLSEKKMPSILASPGRSCTTSPTCVLNALHSQLELAADSFVTMFGSFSHFSMNHFICKEFGEGCACLCFMIYRINPRQINEYMHAALFALTVGQASKVCSVLRSCLFGAESKFAAMVSAERIFCRVREQRKS
jgi:hypothetical protein